MAELDPIIHQPARLRIMATLTALDPGDQVDFTWLRERLELTDGNLGAHLLKLEEAGYIAVDKRFVARKPKTYLSATHKGRGAFEDHVKALRSILDS
jgi:DNA-binding MarR family transcriptional regulator